MDRVLTYDGQVDQTVPGRRLQEVHSAPVHPGVGGHGPGHGQMCDPRRGVPMKWLFAVVRVEIRSVAEARRRRPPDRRMRCSRMRPSGVVSVGAKIKIIGRRTRCFDGSVIFFYGSVLYNSR